MLQSLTHIFMLLEVLALAFWSPRPKLASRSRPANLSAKQSADDESVKGTRGSGEILNRLHIHNSLEKNSKIRSRFWSLRPSIPLSPHAQHLVSKYRL